MSATTTTDKTGVPSSTDTPPEFTDWRPSNERGPTEADEREARERTLEIGNVTEIAWKKAPSDKRDFYERLDKQNRDCRWEFRDEIDMPRNCDNQFKRHALYAIAGELELNSLQRRKSLNRLFQLDLPRFGMRTDVVAFCLCGLVLKAEAERYDIDNPYHPARTPENNLDRFAFVESRLIEVEGRTSKNYIQKIWGKLTQGNPPTRSAEEWKPFVQAHSDIQNHPSHRPEWS